MEDIRSGIAHLRGVCPLMRRIHDACGEPPLRRYDAGFAGLARVVVGQQLSIASAAAIWTRVEAHFAPALTADMLLATPPEKLAALGLSRAKIATLTAVARQISDGELSLERLGKRDAAEIRAELTSLPGIGPWTADIYVMFCLGHADAWAEGDLALQVGTARALGAGDRLRAAELLEVAERWRPWRGVAARLIWSDYARDAAERFARKPAPRLSGVRKKP